MAAARKKLDQLEEAPEATGGVEEISLNQAPSMLDDINNLDDMFDDLEASLPDGAKIVGAPVPEVEHPVEHQIDAGKGATDDELKAAAMQELDAQSAPASDEGKTPKAKGAPKAPSAKRISTAGMGLAEALAVGLGEKLDEILLLDDRWIGLSPEDLFDKRMAVLEALDAPTFPKKIGEKVINLFAAVGKGATLSVYTQMAIDLLAKDGELTSKTLKDAYIARPYSEGTASSQCTQMMKLLPVLGIGETQAGKMVANAHSTLLARLRTPSA